MYKNSIKELRKITESKELNYFEKQLLDFIIEYFKI